MHKVHTILQEPQAFALMLHKMAFWLSGKAVASHFDNTTFKAYFCNQGGIASLFLSRLACCILNLADKHGITLIQAYISTHLNVTANYLSWERFSLVAPSSLHDSGSISPLGSTRGRSVGILTYQTMSAIINIGNPPPLLLESWMGTPLPLLILSLL